MIECLCGVLLNLSKQVFKEVKEVTKIKQQGKNKNAFR